MIPSHGWSARPFPWRSLALRAVPVAAAALLLPAAIRPAAAATAEPPAPHVVRFTPQGTVKDVRQVAARFSEPMVPLGDPRVAADIFEVECPEAGAARWVDSRNWVYDFGRDLPAGVRCTFRLRAGAAALAGNPLGGRREFTFNTGGPAIRSSIPPEGHEGIDEEQAFLLRLDAQPTEASILEHVSFAVEGLPERVGVRILTGEAREAILRARFRRPPAEPLLVLQARQRFPSGSMVKLVWGQGVTSPSGVPTDQDQTLPFKVRGAFKVEFRCERENRYAACIPLTPMRLQFSAPVPWEQARRSALVGPEGRRWTAEAPEDGEKSPAVHQVVFKGPFPEKAAFRVEVPAGLTDDAGRPPINAGAFPLTVRTEEFPPLAKFSARFGIVEWKADPVLPVTVRNLDPAAPPRRRGAAGETGAGAPAAGQAPAGRIVGKVLRIAPDKGEAVQMWLRRLAGAQRNASVFASPEPGSPVKSFALPRPHGAKAFEVMGIPFKEPGLYIVELESVRLGASLLEGGGAMYVPTAALVTNLSVHFKWGRANSLAWVTTLDGAQPVAAADVAVRDCRGKAVWSGKTDAHGIARIGPLPAREALP
ncbi:MAG TPA: alpha-2-macroglobulin, partial [Candidatus Methylomirabilis sp.]